jgi:hypothetical protein
MLTDPALLTESLELYQSEHEDESAPMRARVQVIDGLLAENQSQLIRLIDLYISGDFPKEMLIDIKTRLETNIRALENERASILGHIERKAPTPDQIQDLYDFANAAAKGLEVTEEDLRQAGDY